uniref:Ig-like domain-containing protein n=1 Tax=Nothobranchius furzeri TaxID=105023 RepID=A0A8C6NNJ7_NOTFU
MLIRFFCGENGEGQTYLVFYAMFSQNIVCVKLFFHVSGEPTSCPIELSPIKAVVKHGDPGSVNCSTSDGTSKELGWEASQGGTRKSNATDLPWEVVSVTNWGMKPICYITNTDCQKTVDLVIYTFPESISFRSNESNDEMTEHKAHTFICDIFNIAPVQNLTVQWYKDDAVIHTAILNDETMEPTNLSPAFTFIPTRADRHVRFRCEARMDLGPEGPLFHASSAEYLTDVLCKYVIKHQLLFCYNTFFNSDTSINISDAFSSPSLYVRSVSALSVLPALLFYLNFPLKKNLSPTEFPESVLIGVVDERSPALVGTVLQLQCDIVSVAPAQDLNVRWMFKRGNETIRPGTFFLDLIITPLCLSPVNVSCIMNITLQKIHNDIQVQCVAELNLGPTLPQPPSLTSSPLRITVLYEPRINATKLPETVPVFRGYPEVLVCEADGNPRPVIQWEYSSQTAHVESEGKLNVSDAGVYICRASNDLNSTERVVEVILLEDYLPLIAGIVALTVVIISIIFIFIYSIYYKNTKMRHYSLKNPKFSNQNGNVAHNGWDIQLPVTRLP